MQDDESAIEQLSEFHSASGIGTASGTGRDLDRARECCGSSAAEIAPWKGSIALEFSVARQFDRVVASDDAFIAARENEMEIASGPSPRRARFTSRTSEAPVEVFEELGKERVRSFRRRDAA